MPSTSAWLPWALGSAVFAALTAIFAKIGLEGIDSDFATLVRTFVIVAVLGGMRHPVGAFIGAIVYVLLQNFAIDLFVRERFNLVIGGVFLAIVLFSPDGLLGLWAKLRSSLGRPEISHQKRRPQ